MGRPGAALRLRPLGNAPRPLRDLNCFRDRAAISEGVRRGQVKCKRGLPVDQDGLPSLGYAMSTSRSVYQRVVGKFGRQDTDRHLRIGRGRRLDRLKLRPTLVHLRPVHGYVAVRRCRAEPGRLLQQPRSRGCCR